MIGAYSIMNRKYTFCTIIRIILCLVIFTALSTSTCFAQYESVAAAIDAEEAADALNSLGLFSGSGVGYELDRTPTRAEALVMLLRLIGQADEAAAKHWDHPFQDGGWADAYIGYAYQQGLTTGVSASTFGADEDTTVQQYAAFLLRALGYQNYDFEKSLSLLQVKVPVVLTEGTRFTRGDMVNLSLAALAAPMADGSGTLAAHLANEGLFAWTDYQAARDSVSAPSLSQTTVLIYMIGGNLESEWGEATTDINEILQADMGENINVVLQAGRTKKWENDWLADGSTQRFVFKDGTVVPVSPLLEGAQMSEPETLANFLRWGVTAYPAQQYILIFWNHGGGTLYGYGYDELNGRKWLMLSELNQALSWADVQFEMVGFDTCLMATMSTAYMISSHADYLLASEEMEPSKGWRYTNWLTQLSRNPGIEMRQLFDVIAHDFFEDALKEEDDWSCATISLIDLEQIEAVIDAWRDVSKDMVQQLQDGRYADIEQALLNSKAYGQGTAYDQVDMIDFMVRLESMGVVSAKTLQQAVENAVICCSNALQMDHSNGLALYVPHTKFSQYPSKVRKSLLGSGYCEEDLIFWDKFYEFVKENGPKRRVWPK